MEILPLSGRARSPSKPYVRDLFYYVFLIHSATFSLRVAPSETSRYLFASRCSLGFVVALPNYIYFFCGCLTKKVSKNITPVTARHIIAAFE